MTSLISTIAEKLRTEGFVGEDIAHDLVEDIIAFVVKEMREPGGNNMQEGLGRGGTPYDVWPAMIDAILAEHQRDEK